MRISDWSSDVCSSDLAAFLGESEHYESRYHLTLTWLPTADSAEAAGRSLVDRPDAEKGRDWRSALASFTAESDRALDLFASIMPEVRALDASETLTVRHGTIPPRAPVVRAPAHPNPPHRQAKRRAREKC